MLVQDGAEVAPLHWLQVDPNGTSAELLAATAAWDPLTCLSCITPRANMSPSALATKALTAHQLLQKEGLHHQVLPAGAGTAGGETTQGAS